MDTERRKFPLTDPSRATLSAEARTASALEYIAHYLEGIEEHLKKIATTLTEDPGDGQLTIMRALQDIADSSKQD